MSVHRTIVASFFTTILAFGAVAAVEAKPVVVVALSQATIKTDGDGTAHAVPLDENTAVGRNMLIRYTIAAKNSGDDDAQHLSLVGRIPTGTTYVPGSAHGAGGYAEFSLDGKAFSQHPMVTVKTPDGDVTKPADPALYTMIRWIDGAALPAHAGTAFSYDVRVK